MTSNYAAAVPDYSELTGLLAATPRGTPWEALLNQAVIPYLVRVWLDHYRMAAEAGDIVEVPLGQYSYLFDIGPDRLIAAWGISRGRFSGARPNSRIQRFPVANRHIYDAGHAISHRLGGGTDINLTAQLASVNRRPFQELEQKAIKTPGCLYFTYWMYNRTGEKIQLASRIQQGLMAPGSQPDIRVFEN